MRSESQLITPGETEALLPISSGPSKGGAPPLMAFTSPVAERNDTQVPTARQGTAAGWRGAETERERKLESSNHGKIGSSRSIWHFYS